MKNQNKNRMIILVALISMLLMIIPLNNVSALSVTYTEGFQGGVVGTDLTLTQSASGKMTTMQHSLFHVYADGRSGSPLKCIGNGASCNGWFNFSYSKSSYITSISWYQKFTGGGGSVYYLEFYNSSYSSLLHPDAPTTNLNKYIMAIQSQFGDHIHGLVSGSFVNFCTAYDFVWDKVTINILNNLGDIQYIYTHSGISYYLNTTAGNSTQIYNNWRIDRCNIYASSPFYIDDINFTISDSYAGSGTSGCLDTTGLTQVGHFGYCAGDIQTSHVYKKYNIPVTTTVSGIELQVSPDQYSEDPDLSHYELSINGLSIGNPICFNPESYYYVLQWDTSYTVTNDLLTFDFYHSQKTGNRYWAIGESCRSTDDLDADGDISYQYTDYTVSYEWKWILFIPFHVPVSTPYTLTRNRDLSMRWWCSGFPSQETYNYPDTLGLHNYYAHNATGYIYDVSLGYDTITGSYTLGNPALTYILELYHNTTQLYQYGFPISCRYPGSGFGFSPTIIGKYYIRLKSTTYRANITAWVIGTFPSFTISTNPAITNQYENYNVNYRYYHPQGYGGGIAMDYYQSMLNQFIKCFYQRYPLTANSTTGFLYSSNSSQAEYWGLYSYANNVYSKMADATHFIRIPSIFDNDIHPSLPNLVIVGNNENNNQMMLLGTHIFPGSDVSVYVNGIFLRDVGDSQYFTVGYAPTKIGTFNATLVLFQNNSNVLLDYCSFTVSSSDTEPGQGGGGLGFDIHDFIPSPYDLFVCIGFIIFMVMLPTIIIVSLQKKIPTVQLHIPDLVMTFASIATGFCGFILTVIWGLLSWVWFFAFTFTLIIILALLYYSGHKSGGGGNATQ